MTDREPIVQRRLNVLVDSDIHRQLRQTALAADVPMATVIQNALVEHFNKEESSNEQH
jgi:hypothetical protein